MAGPFRAPPEKGVAWTGIVIGTVFDPEVVGWGGHDQVHAVIREFGHALQAIAMVKLE